MSFSIDRGNKRTFGKRRAFHKIKHLRLVTPERANELGIPAEAPVLCSPYITQPSTCFSCGVTYTPLIYQIGQETEAQHFCKEDGGGIYVQLPEDTSTNWQYYKGLFTAHVKPQGPIRMGNDRGYQFRSVTPIKIELTRCYHCQALLDSGNLEFKDSYGDAHPHELVPVCMSTSCKWPLQTDLEYNQQFKSEWHFAINSDGSLSFTTNKRLTLPDNAGVLKYAR